MNATAVGLHSGEDPSRLELEPGLAASSSTSACGDGATALIGPREAGVRAVGGLEMLVRRALSFERWTGRPAPLDAMRHASIDV